MIIPSNMYPGQIDTTDPRYPYGKAQKSAYDGDPSGTPFAMDDLNDRWGWQAALLASVGATPSGDPETQGNSQMLNAIKQLIAEAKPASSMWQTAKGCLYGTAAIMQEVVTLGDAIIAVGYNPASGKGLRGVSTDNGGTFTFEEGLDHRIFAAASNGAEVIAIGENTSADRRIYKTTDGVAWTRHPAPAITSLYVAISGSAWIVGNANSIYISNNEGVTWTDITPPGTLSFRNIRYLEGIIFACHSGGVVQSGTWGSSWSGLALSNQNWKDISRVGSVLIVVSDGVNKVAYSPGTGVFKELNGLPISGVAATLDKVIYDGRDSFYAVGAGGVFVTPSGGWGAPFVPLAANFHGNTLCVTSTGRIILGGNGGMIVYTG